MTINYLKYGIVSVLILAIIVMFSVSFVQANPSFFIRQNDGTGTTATTTKLGYLTPGTATTTVYFDAQANGNPFGAESAILALQLMGSTTPANAAVATTTFNVALEYAQAGENCISAPTSCDWYPNFVLATTTQLGWQTNNGVLVASTSATKEFITVPTPTRYTRAVISVSTSVTSNLNGSVWGEFIAKKEQK